jgi:hypothetical protein
MMMMMNPSGAAGAGFSSSMGGFNVGEPNNINNNNHQNTSTDTRNIMGFNPTSQPSMLERPDHHQQQQLLLGKDNK